MNTVSASDRKTIEALLKDNDLLSCWRFFPGTTIQADNHQLHDSYMLLSEYARWCRKTNQPKRDHIYCHSLMEVATAIDAIAINACRFFSQF